MVVTDECINCSACIEECEQDAIHNAGEEYTVNGSSFAAVSDDHTYIVAELCTDCKSCVDVCAVDAIVEA